MNVWLSLYFLHFLMASPQAPPPFLSGPSQVARLTPRDSERMWVRGRPVDATPPSPTLWALQLAEEDLFRSLGPRVHPQGTYRQPSVPAELPWLVGMKYPDIPVVFDETVIRYLKHFRFDPAGRATIRAWIEASGRWRTMILDALARHKLPSALLYIAMIESGFSVRTRSSAGALGLWQFMPEGAKTYGLRITHFMDQRMDPELSTEAVMLYFADLKFRFRDWHLAMAAYNCGYGRVMQSMRRYQTNDFWKLQKYENALPRETQLYIPKWIAVAIADLNRDLFLLPKLTMATPYAFEEALAPGGMTLAKVAQLAKVSAEDIVQLNPEYLRMRLPPGVKMARVRLPWGSRTSFDASMRRLSPDWADFSTHVVQFGETVEMIASRYKTTAARIRALNQMESASDLRWGMVIVVPKTAKREDPVRPPLKTPFVAVPSDIAVPEGRVRMFYRTCAQDTVELIAEGLNVSVEDLVAWNHLNPDAALVSDMVLQVFVEPGATRHAALFSPDTVKVVVVDSEEFIAHYLDAYDRVRILHTITTGQTLEKIAERYDTSVFSIRTINKGYSFPPGTTLVVYAKKNRVPRNMPVQEKSAQNETRENPEVQAQPKVPSESSSPVTPESVPATPENGTQEKTPETPPSKPVESTPPSVPPTPGHSQNVSMSDAAVRIVVSALQLLVNLSPQTLLISPWKRDQALPKGSIWLGGVSSSVEGGKF